MYKRVFLLAVSLLFVLPISAQDDSTITYISADGAIQFEYSAEWMFKFEAIPKHNEFYSYTFFIPMVSSIDEVSINYLQENTLMSFPMGTLSSAYFSSFLVEFINPRTDNIVSVLDSPMAYADHFAMQIWDKSVKSFDTRELELLSYPAVSIEPINGRFPEQETRMYFIMRDDGWIMVVTLSMPTEYMDNRDNFVSMVLESFMFDAELAAEPFERNLEAYDYSDVELTQTFNYSDGSFTIDYPEDWEALEPDPRYVSPTTQVQFTVSDDDVEIRVLIVDVTYGGTSGMTPQSIMEQRRNLSQDITTEFLIDDKEAVGIGEWIDEDTFRYFVSFALNDAWIAEGIIDSDSEETVSKYEATLVAILSTLEFTPIEYIETVMALNSPIPENWTTAQMDWKHGEYCLTYIDPLFQNDTALTIIVSVWSAELNGLGDYLDANGMTAAIFDPYHTTSESEILEIGSETVTRVAIETSNGVSKGIAHIYRPDDEWVVIIFLFSYDESELEDYVPLVEEIIETSEFEVSF